jgi:transposase-like protein
MGQVLHGTAATTEAVRRAIQRSQESLRTLAKRDGIRRPPVRLSPPALVSMEVRRTTNAIERLHEEFKRYIKSQTVLPSAETAAMLFWALLTSGQIIMRKVDGWQTLAERIAAGIMVDLAA